MRSDMATNTSAPSAAKLGTLTTPSRRHASQVENSMKSNENDLQKYFSQKDRIAELERELKKQRRRASEYKAKWRMSIGDHELPTDKARKLIRRAKLAPDGSITAMCKQIAAEVGLAYNTVRVLWYE